MVLPQIKSISYHFTKGPKPDERHEKNEQQWMKRSCKILNLDGEYGLHMMMIVKDQLIMLRIDSKLQHTFIQILMRMKKNPSEN